jgi:hypothetical protein
MAPTALPDGRNLAVGAVGNFLDNPKLDGANRNAMSTISSAAVPEPGTLALLLMVLAGSLMARWPRGCVKASSSHVATKAP